MNICNNDTSKIYLGINSIAPQETQDSRLKKAYLLDKIGFVSGWQTR